jgi:hypothetical protein
LNYVASKIRTAPVLCKIQMYWKKPPQRILRWPLPSKEGTYCTHLAGFYEDDMSPWVLSSIHIQRFACSVGQRYVKELAFCTAAARTDI